MSAKERERLVVIRAVAERQLRQAGASPSPAPNADHSMLVVITNASRLPPGQL